MDNSQDAGPCDHFSIRGYVAKMRENNINVCYPFFVDDNQNITEEQENSLPPLDVVKFKRWDCHNCFREIEAEYFAKQIGKVPVCSSFGSFSNSVMKGKSVIACTELNNGENLDSSCDYEMVKKNEVVQSRADQSRTTDLGGNAENNSSNTICERPPKVHLLTELLGLGGNAVNDQSRTTDFVNSASNFCEYLPTQTIAKQNSKEKRKIIQDENGKPPLLPPKKFKLSKQKAKLAKRNCMVIDLEIEENSGSFVQQKNPKGGYLTFMPHLDVEIDPYDKRPIFPLQAERQYNMSKKANKQIGNWGAIPVPDLGSEKGLVIDLNEKIASPPHIFDVQTANPWFQDGSIQHSRELNRGFDLNAIASESLDIQPNEAIPAMQLISLMDYGMKSNHIPNYDRNDKRISKPIPTRHPKEQFWKAFAVPCNSSKSPPSALLYGKNLLKENSLSAFRPFSSTCPSESIFQGANGIPTGAPLKFREKNKGHALNCAHKKQKSVYVTSDFENNQGSSSHRGPQCMSRRAIPTQSLRGIELCNMNRNPAEFSVLEPENIYTIDFKDII